MRYVFALLLAGYAVTPISAAQTIGYVEDVAPILRKYCAGCHNEEDAEAEFRLDSYASLMKGGDSGSVITPGAATSSRVLQMVLGKIEPVMPPEDETQPSEDEIAILESWIDQGAVGPSGDAPMTTKLSTPAIKVSATAPQPITSVALSPDGSLRAVARFGQVQILKNRKDRIATISGLPGKVNSLQFSRDGRRILVASGLTGAYGRAAIYEVRDGTLLKEMIGHRDTIYAAVFSPDETIVATAGYDRDILLWDVGTAEAVRELTGHNGAIFDLAFSPDGRVLASACADETVKVWSVETGRRLDTLSQSEGEVLAVDFTKDGKFIVAAGGDNRLRVWRFLSKTKPRINPIVATRFVDESPLVGFAFSVSGDSLIVLADSGNIKVIRTGDWDHVLSLRPLDDVGSDLCVTPDGNQILLASMSGRIETRSLPPLPSESSQHASRQKKVYMDLGEPIEWTEKSLREKQSDQKTIAQSMIPGQGWRVGRGVVITGTISSPGEEDRYQWTCGGGEVWAIDADAIQGSPIDPMISVLDETGQPVLRVRLQAVRDSYFTFRGKNSMQINDFRLFNWQEMRLGQYLYASGEVTRLWMHPRGPDSGFNVYPGEGSRRTYFGTTHAAHALGEPAYIVRPLRHGESEVANGLPVFNVYYENDDDPMRLAGKNSRLLFTAPRDGNYTVRVSDTRGDGGEEFAYRLAVRAAKPEFKPTVAKMNTTLRKGSGREFIVRVDRIDGFDGPVIFDCENLSPEVHSTFPVIIEQGQRFAAGTIWIDERTDSLSGDEEPSVTATAMIGGRKVQRRVGTLGKLTVGAAPSVIPTVQPIDRTVPENESWTLQVRRGETVSARVLLRRKEGFVNLVSFGKEDAGRGATQGVYVDNIGLNGLLLPAQETEREFFLTADPTAVPGRRPFFLRAQVDGNVTSHPIIVEVLP